MWHKSAPLSNNIITTFYPLTCSMIVIVLRRLGATSGASPPGLSWPRGLHLAPCRHCSITASLSPWRRRSCRSCRGLCLVRCVVSRCCSVSAVRGSSWLDPCSLVASVHTLPCTVTPGYAHLARGGRDTDQWPHRTHSMATQPPAATWDHGEKVTHTVVALLVHPLQKVKGARYWRAVARVWFGWCSGPGCDPGVELSWTLALVPGHGATAACAATLLAWALVTTQPLTIIFPCIIISSSS